MATAFPKDRTDNWEHIGGQRLGRQEDQALRPAGRLQEMEKMWVTKKSRPSHTGGEVHSPGPPSVSARGHFRQRCHCLVKWAISSESELLTRG